jgi:wyosine [tRNA(Phe)-imidazoG37] synthetase (radical SAM superfamily)
MSSVKSPRLNISDHDRSAAGLRYVYPVVSRRAGGVSVGINLNPNNACNWRCLYCQVPGLVRGAAPKIELPRLEHELDSFLREVLNGDFLSRHVPESARRLNDIALSGNGEPTTSTQFGEVIDLIGRVRAKVAVPPEVKTVLITNGSLLHRPGMRVAIGKLASLNGEIWFKIDRGSEPGIRLVNNARIGLKRVRENLGIAARSCATWIQTCVFSLDGAPPSEQEQQAYLDLLKECLGAGIPIRGVLLYGLARQSFQPEAARLSSLPAEWLQGFAARIEALGLPVKVTP